MTIKTSPAIIEFAKFVHTNPGAQRGEILDYLWTKITYNTWTKLGKGVFGYRPVTKLGFKKNACGHIFSLYNSNRLSNVLGSEINTQGVTKDWYRVKGANGRYSYFLSAFGERLLTAVPLTDRATDPIDIHHTTRLYHYRA